MSAIVVSAVLIQDHNGHVLHVRKRGTNSLMLPGGKPEDGEAAHTTAIREFVEELGVDLDETLLVSIGTFTTPAANEADMLVTGHVFEHPFVQVDAPLAEIEHLEWIDPAHPPPNTAPLSLKVFEMML